MKLNPIHGLLGVLGAGAGLWFWSEKRKKASGVNTAVLNNPPPQDAIATDMVYSTATKPVLGQSITIFDSTNHPVGKALVIWIQTLESGMKAPAIAVRTESGSRWFVKPSSVA